MRYSRQIILPEIGEEGQQKLQKASVLIVGVGGLGSPIALYLCAAGVGTIGVIDHDKVNISNLQRQVIYTEADLEHQKALCAANHLKALNSKIICHSYPTRLTKENAKTIIENYDIIVDGCDNFSTRYLINDTCIELGKVYVYGAINEFEGQVSVFNYGKPPTKSYRDLYPDEANSLETPTTKGVLGVTPAIVGIVEATETIKIICGFGEVLSGKLWTIDLRTWQSNIFSL